MNIINHVPQEIIYNMLIQASYNDIIRYCNSHKSALIICSDDIFWLNKLDYEATFTLQDGTRIIPSYYINLFKTHNETGKQFYTRWIKILNDESYDINYETLEQGNWDVIIFKLQSQNPSQFKYNLSRISTAAIYYGEITILDGLTKLGYIPQYNDIINSITYNRPDTLQWLTDHALDTILQEINTNPNPFIRTRRLSEIEKGAIRYGNLDIINKLINIGYEPTLDSILLAIQFGQLNILQWFETHNTHTDDFIKTNADTILDDIELAIINNIPNIIDILQWLTKYDIYPNQTIIDLALRRKRTDIIDWLSTHNISLNYNIESKDS